MLDIKSILKSINTDDKSEKNVILINELQNITSECLKKLQAIRNDLTSAYIVSQHVIINENDKYVFKPEKDVRTDNQQNLDLDKAQREEEKILKDILDTIDPRTKDRDKRNNIKISAQESDTSNRSKNIFIKIKNLIQRLMSSLYPKDKVITIPDETNKMPIELMEQNINNIKIYSNELDKRAKSLKNIQILQERISQYKERIADPKEYNKKKDFVAESIQQRKQFTQGKKTQHSKDNQRI